jgi:ActR/RegA family two-component response regulator
MFPADTVVEGTLKTRPVALVIDADEGDCVPGHRALADLEWEVVIVSDPAAGVQLFQKSPEKYDLVLIGLSPNNEAETTTIEAVREIREDMPILVCARLTEYSLPDLTPYRPAAFLLKPYGTDDVREAIERVTHARKGRVGNGH